jgi:diguanylate cyclase (GGDEF)-like protein
MGLPGAPGPVLTLLAAVALAAVVRGLELAAVLALAAPLPAPREIRRRAWIDGLQVLAACGLAHEIAAAHLVGSIALILALLAAAGLGTALDVARAEVRRAMGRITRSQLELDTLHAVGREILASLDTSHVLGVLDSETRKVLEADTLVVALAEPGRSRLCEVYRRRGDGPALRAGTDLDDALTRWTLEELRGRRIDELPRARPAGPGLLLDPEARSALVVPMIVEGRLLGLVAAASREARAYDDAQLAVLATMAQQAAAAIDNARHHRLATIDSLTGFYLRDYFFRWLEEEQQRLRRYGGSLAVLMIDLDAFKGVNDDHGHLAGDRYLADIAQVVRAELRSADVACRLGGDEFCVMLPQTDLAGARIIAERIRNAVSRRVVAVDGAALRTTVSIGVAAYPEQATRDVAELVRLADEALYRAKREGRDRVAPWAA